MTITEATDVAVLLQLLGTAEPVTTERVVESAIRLEERVHKALHAGPRVDPDVVRVTTDVLLRPAPEVEDDLS